MSAFAVAIGGKADMTFCSAHVCFWPKADISSCTAHVRFQDKAATSYVAAWSAESDLTWSILGPLSLYRAVAVDTRVTWPIEHIAASGAKLLLFLNKALGYTARIRDSVPAKPHRIRRTCICIILGISDRWQGCQDGDNESNSAEYTHSVSLPNGPKRQ